MFLLVPAYPGSPGQKAVKRLCVCVCACVRVCVDSISSTVFVQFKEDFVSEYQIIDNYY